MTTEQINTEPRQPELQLPTNKSEGAGKLLTPQHSHAKLSQLGPQAQARVYNMRCPSCAKLYKVEAKDILSSSPHFQCQCCKTEFTFDYPPRHPHAIPTRPLKLQNFSLPKASHRDLEIHRDFVKKCPKCGNFNSKAAEECQKCHVLLARVDGLPLEPKFGALPSLVKAWHELMSDYDNVTKHLAFVDRCEDLRAIPFALKKYQALKEAQPQDPVAEQMLQKVWMKALARRADQVVEASKVRKVFSAINSKINWPKVIVVAPWILYSLLILTGMFSSALRNMVGIGVSLFFIHLGLRVFSATRVMSKDQQK